jgi:hypothetical protein
MILMYSLSLRIFLVAASRADLEHFGVKLSMSKEHELVFFANSRFLYRAPDLGF